MKHRSRTNVSAIVGAIFLGLSAFAHGEAASPRERISFDRDWRFTFGHATDRSRDFDPANSFFSYLAKTGFAVGAAAADFDDRGWRDLDLPHDWAVESPFDERGSSSHGSKAIGRNFPERSIGWYRKTFFIPTDDHARRVSLVFDGVFRDSQVWVNGHYLGREESGYDSFAYNISEYLNYGGENTVAVRVDASLEEGWFYEGAGIYRHVWLVKTAPLHVERDGTFVTCKIKENSADVTARVEIVNESVQSRSFEIEQSIVDSEGAKVAVDKVPTSKLEPFDRGEFTVTIPLAKPIRWSLEAPHLYTLVTTVREQGAIVDRYETRFGVRDIRFDADEGFFLNGKHVKIHGTNNHQDHAGVGAAIPNALQEFRISRLKELGCNAYRTSHNPPTPELLDACDRLGMLVLDENRSMGTTPTQLVQLERLIRRDRNHPCVILWSVGNEEWGIEGNGKGDRVAATMQAVAQRLDPTRRTTVASSGNWGGGYSIPIDVMGFNYYTHGNSDDFHKKFPNKPSLGTEEGSTLSTRGVYVERRDRQHLTAYDENKPDWGSLAHQGWGHYADRKYLAGLFVWTGFDYRGEPTPFGWPAISSQFGILDTCGFRKDNSYYYQAWWTDTPLVHLLPHWNWSGKEGQPIRVWAHSNCDEVELFLNGETLGRKKVERNSHVDWEVPYQSGTLLARGFKAGVEAATDQVETTDEAVAVRLTPHRSVLHANGQDVSMITVEVVDAAGRAVPTANCEVTFHLAGPGRIRGVGNGDPSSHEPDVFLDDVAVLEPTWRFKAVQKAEQQASLAIEFDDSPWRSAYGRAERGARGRDRESPDQVVYRGVVELSAIPPETKLQLDLRSVANEQAVYLNGALVLASMTGSAADRRIDLDRVQLRPGKNVIAIVASGFQGGRNRGEPPDSGRSPAIVRKVTPSGPWKRNLFNGLAQVIVQSASDPGDLRLEASSPGLRPVTLQLTSQAAVPATIAQSGTRNDE